MPGIRLFAVFRGELVALHHGHGNPARILEASLRGNEVKKNGVDPAVDRGRIYERVVGDLGCPAG